MHTKKVSLYPAILLFLIFVCTSVVSFAQTNISSPYSRYGLGQLNDNNNFRLSAMGGMGIAYKNNTCINISNPATYAAFDSTSFLFEGGIRGIVSQVSNSNTSVLTNNISFNYLLFGLPISKRFSGSFGLLPFSNVGYKLNDSDSLDNIGNINYFYEGEGGFNKAFLGLSYSITPHFSIGVNANYLFGSLKKIRMVTFPEVPNIFSMRQYTSTQAKDFIFDGGLYYEKKLKNSNSLAFGLTYTPSMKLSATQEVLSETFTGVNYGLTHIKDTIENTITEGHLSMPAGFAGGLVFRKGNKWLIGADYKFQEWSQFSSFGTADSMNNSFQVNLGGEISPTYSPTASILRNSTYRIGVRYEQTYLQIKNSSLQNYAFSFGMGLPIPRSKTHLNVGIEIGQRGTTNNNLIKETYGLLTFSLSIYERWFVRRKFD